MSDNGRHEADDTLEPDERREEEGGDDYSDMLLLEDLESLREQMEEAGVENIEQARTWLEAPASDKQRGIPSTANRAALQAVVDLMAELEVSNMDELDQRIRKMQEDVGWE